MSLGLGWRGPGHGLTRAPWICRDIHGCPWISIYTTIECGVGRGGTLKTEADSIEFGHKDDCFRIPLGCTLKTSNPNKCSDAFYLAAFRQLGDSALAFPPPPHAPIPARKDSLYLKKKIRFLNFKRIPILLELETDSNILGS